MKCKSKFILAALFSLFGFTASLVDLSEFDVQLPSFFGDWAYQEEISAEEVENLPDFDGQNVVIQVNGNNPSFTAEEMSMDAGTWQTFSDLDSLNRVGVADALLHRSMMPIEERGDISKVYPTGWNQKKLENNVWLYNRIHLIGFQMTVENDNWKNLFTGTQQLNQIHVRYRVTPIFRERELLPRAIQMEARSIETNDIQCVNPQRARWFIY
ncbi:DNA-entry nuclease (plasmid) [Enterococcus mundtii QU 25]|uniref:DNA/RNA non-specific endonuclease n=1 Tax=Enterococcus mundtii TaxID=53346 RepID=UPI0003C54C12|nr:DNA-entry nuclease [Enterococcus mundtii QU 25]